MESELNSDIKELTSQIRDFVTQKKIVEAQAAVVKNVDEKLVNQLIKTAAVLGQCPGVNVQRLFEYLPLYLMIH